VLILLLK
jgi:hypothetical protein